MFDTFLLKFTALVCLWGELLTWKLKGLIKYPCWCYWEIEMAIWGGEVTSKNQFGVDKSRLGLWFRHWSQHFFMDQSCQIVCDSETLLRTINGSSSFCKGPRTSKVWKSKDPKGPRTLRLCMSKDLCKNYYSHLYFAVVTNKKLVKTWLSKNLDGKNHYHPRIFTTMQNHILMIQKWTRFWIFSRNVITAKS